MLKFFPEANLLHLLRPLFKQNDLIRILSVFFLVLYLCLFKRCFWEFLNKNKINSINSLYSKLYPKYALFIRQCIKLLCLYVKIREINLLRSDLICSTKNINDSIEFLLTHST